MIYTAKEICDIIEINSCNDFFVDNFQWNSLVQPITYGKMGFINDGFGVELTCEEISPKAEYKNHLDPVYKDSAMEAFFSFIPLQMEKPTVESFYINIEFNSNGAVYAAYGCGRKNRVKFSDEQIKCLKLQLKKDTSFWRAGFLLPKALIDELYPQEHKTWVNFYKISESPEIEHYGSFSKIDSNHPNFHRPDCFAQVEIECIPQKHEKGNHHENY